MTPYRKINTKATRTTLSFQSVFLTNSGETDFHTYTKEKKKEMKSKNLGKLHLFIMWIHSRRLQSIQYQGLKWQQSFQSGNVHKLIRAEYSGKCKLVLCSLLSFGCVRLSSHFCRHGMLFGSVKAIEFCSKPGFNVAARTECVCCCTNTLTVLVTGA